jgi:hypothetical protein
MYNVAFQSALIDSRVADLRRARQQSIQPDTGRETRDFRTTRPSTRLRRATWSRRS